MRDKETETQAKRSTTSELSKSEIEKVVYYPTSVARLRLFETVVSFFHCKRALMLIDFSLQLTPAELWAELWASL